MCAQLIFDFSRVESHGAENFVFFIEFFVGLDLFNTNPITSSKAERSLSKLKLLFAPNRSTMSVIRINNLALMGTHRNRLVDISTEFIVKKFKGKPRKATFNKDFANQSLSSDSDVESDEGSFYLLFFSLSRHSFIKHHLILWSKSYLSLFFGLVL